MNGKVRIAQSSSDLRSFLEETAKRAELELRKIKFSEQNHWSTKGGALSHISNGFFHFAGIRNRITDEEHLILFQPQTALTGLAIYMDGLQVYVLLQARVEPGLPNVAQYGPTIQATPTNYLQMHGGKRTSCVDLFRSFSPIANPLANNIQSDLGKRYFQKNKVHSYLELSKQIETQDNMIWVPLQVVAEVIVSDHFLNPDLRSLLSGFDWDLFVDDDISCNSKIEVPEDNSFAFTSNLLGKNEWKLIALEQLTGWEIRDDGIADVSDSGIWVDMFNISCFTREVEEWSQPFLSCSNRGLVVLLARRIKDHFEFLVSIESEFGISGQRTILPSFVIYPGDNSENVNQFFEEETLIAEMGQSEEGNRFHKNECVYRIILVADDIDIEPHQRWVTAETLKEILISSGRASLQLRSMASLLLDVLNPIAHRLQFFGAYQWTSQIDKIQQP